jgi:amidohydrolase
MERLPEMGELVALRRGLHEHAELAGSEIETSGIIRRFLESRGPDQLMAELGGAGLAAVFEGREDGPTVMLRADIDAVPVQEANDLAHRSRRPGVSHTCGHDGHAAILAGLAARLSRHRPVRGRAVLLFQPAEETGFGARSVLEDSRFESIGPDWIFALHNLPGETFGEIQIREGPFAAGSVGAIFRLKGRTSHAAYPEQGTSPALAVAQLIQDLTALPDGLRQNDGIAKLTVIHARIGEPAFGTTPGEAVVMATLRSDREQILDVLRDGAVSMANRIAATHGLEVDSSWTDDFPVTINHPEAVTAIEAVAEARGIAVVLRDLAYPWSEDFGWFTRRFKGAIFGLGAGEEHPALHSPHYDFPDELIPVGIGLFEGLVERILG